MGGTRFKLNLKLQNLSMISIAVRLWDSQDIKSRIKNYFSNLEWEYEDYLLNLWQYQDQNWREISKLVVQHANSMELPPSLSPLLKKAILLIGQKIYDWIYYVTKILELDFIFSEKIYFSFGVIDEIKIFDLYWRDLMASDNFTYQKYFFSSSPLFCLACMYGCEGFIKERKTEMLDELSKSDHEIKTGDEMYNIMSFFICKTSTIIPLPKDSPQQMKISKAARSIAIYLESDSPQQMFEGCLLAGFSKAARFYWEKLDEIEKISNLNRFAKTCFSQQYNLERPFKAEKYCEILLFLINQMEEEERYLFITDCADGIIGLFLPVWPYQELIVDLPKYDWNIESSKLLNMVYFLISLSARMNILKFPLVNEFVFPIMQKAWGNISVDEKIHFLKENLRLSKESGIRSALQEELTISSFFLTLNPEVLNLLFNDPSITEVDGKKMDFFIKKGFIELVKFGKIDFLKEISETIFKFIPEPKEFLKEEFSDYLLLLNLMENDKSCGFLNQFLDWTEESDAERARLKNQMNTMYVCRSLTEPREDVSLKCELADTFLKWKLETDAEVKCFKDEMKSYNFVIVDSWEYIRIKSGDLSWLRPMDLLAMRADEYPYENKTDGFTFLKFEDGIELNRGVVLGIKSFCSDVDHDIFGPDGCQAERRPVKYVGTKVGDYIVFIVREIWSCKRIMPDIDIVIFSDLDEAVNLSNAVIKFYYETDEEVLKFKKKKLQVLVTEDIIEFLLYTINRRKDYPSHFLNHFCKFCMISSEKIEEIKIRQRSDIETFLDIYLIDQLNFRLTDFYLNWLFGRVKKREVSKTFLNSSNKGALLCVSYLKQCDEVSAFRMDSGIRRWLRLVDDMEKLKNDVFAMSEITPEWFPALLDWSARSSYQDILDELDCC